MKINIYKKFSFINSNNCIKIELWKLSELRNILLTQQNPLLFLYSKFKHKFP